MKVTEFTRQALAARREARTLTRLGFRQHETDWEIIRGSRTKEVIVEARISFDGKSIWTKLGKKYP